MTAQDAAPVAAAAPLPAGPPVAAGPTRPAGRPRLRELDLLRFIAALMVVLLSLLIFLGTGHAYGMDTYARCIQFMTVWLLLSAFAKEGDSDLLNAILTPDWAPYFIAGMALYLVHRFGSNLILWLFAVMALVAVGALRFLDWRWLALLGGLTYPLCRVQEALGRPIISELHASVNPRLLLGIALTTVVVVAALVHLLIEKPAARWLSAQLKKSLAQIRAGGAVLPERSGNGAH